MKIVGKGVAKRIAVEIIGWTLVVLGLAALVLPGPGLLALFAGIAVLATQYEWAERRMEPLRQAALKAARDSVSSWQHIVISLLGVCVLVAAGIMWGVQPSEPSWWPLAAKFWLPGGWGTGASLLASAAIALGMIAYSYFKLRHTD
jgi:4-hydroxybenzoate polyprenyltransferase